MFFIISGFIFGALIPYMARRFAKFMPATMGYALYRLIWPTKKVSKLKQIQNGQYQKLKHQYLMRSLGWAVVCSAISFAGHLCLPSSFYIALIWISLLLYEIDKRMLLLPDILTVPLLIIGFWYASVQGNFALASALGALFGYILPVAASLFMIKKHPEAFGGGDIKLISAVGAWIGADYVPLLILMSSLIFGAFCLIKREKSGAFGPSIVISTLILVFFLI